MGKSREYWHSKLKAMQTDLLQLEAESKEGREAVELDQSRVGRLSRIDAMQSQAMNKAIGTRRKQALARIDAAFERISEDEFGYCLKCGEKIEKKRLAFDPTAIYCTPCSAQA